MQIIETKIESKTFKSELCEDGLFISDDFIAIIDGVTAKGKHLWQGKTSGRYAKDIILNELTKMPKDIQAYELFGNLSKRLKVCYNKEMDKEVQEEKLRASIIIYTAAHEEVWSYGDCQCIIDGVYYTHKKSIDSMNENIRCFILQNALLNGKTYEQLSKEDIGREAIQEFMKMQFSFENKEMVFGYPILNGDEIKESLIKRYKATKGKEIVLASDGYPMLYNTLDESESYLRKQLKTDPLCCREFFSTKGVLQGNQSFDDRSYCRVVI